MQSVAPCANPKAAALFLTKDKAVLVEECICNAGSLNKVRLHRASLTHTKKYLGSFPMTNLTTADAPTPTAIRTLPIFSH